jgi:hypothetical protein
LITEQLQNIEMSFTKKRFYFNHIATFGGNRTNINKTQQA